MSNKYLIAIVDDDDAVREALFDLLQVEELAARMFADGAELLRDPAVNDFDCVISDVRMAEVDGLELQRLLRVRGCHMPVIFITSSVEASSRARALSEGAEAWFTKPVADEVLLRSLWTALRRSASDGMLD